MTKVFLTENELKTLSADEQKIALSLKQSAQDAVDFATKNNVSKDELTAALNGLQTKLSGEILEPIRKAQEETQSIALKQGTTLSEIASKLDSNGRVGKTIAMQLKEDEAELKSIYKNRNGQKTYLLNYNSKGEPFMVPFDETSKAPGTTATINGLGAGNVASIAQNLDAATLLRLGGNSNIVSQYRNTPWVFNLCNLITAGFENPFAIWFEETAKDGSSATVLEGGLKPLVQYKYNLQSSSYKKEAVMVTFTEEFHLDFPRLEADIMQKVQVDLVNRMNSAILPNITAAATAYNSGVSFQNGVVVPNVNDFDVLAAMAAQVDNATFSASASSAVMSTFKKHRLGITKDNTGAYINPPASLAQLAFVGNPTMSADDIIVGDFRNYNIIQRGGVIVRVGYNGNDFAENKFSVVAEQFYFDYISTVRRSAIVKGPTFAAVRTAISI